MSTGRGRGYTGRHHLRDPRPGDLADEQAARTLAELSPRSTPTTTTVKMEANKEKMKEPDMSEDKPAEDSVKEAPVMKPDVKYHMNTDDDAMMKELLNVDEQYTPLLALLEQFSPGEDGIQFNRKLRHFETTVTNMCTDETKLHQAFATFRAAALCSAVTARKLAAVGASFTRQQRQLMLRGALLNVVMQGTFSKLDLLERANPLYLINAANLMGDYFAEARLCNGNKVHILASPLLQYLRSLLISDDIRAHRSLATQLMQNGRELLSVLATELDALSISIRLRLLTPPPVSIIWLLLSADLCLNKFLPLPSTLQQFYAAHLELNCDDNFSEVNYGSWKKPEKEDYRSDGSETDKASQNLSQISLNQEEDHKPKLRPILGAGAGLLRQEQTSIIGQDCFDTWTNTNKSSLSKRYDLNSWRQTEEDKSEEEPVYNPTVLPPNIPSFPQPITVPDFPPPAVRYNNYPQENFPNYLQQGDGAYIQNQYQNNFPPQGTQNFNSQGDFNYPTERQSFEKPFPTTPVEKTQEFVTQYPQSERSVERVNNEVQKNSARRPIENWRKEKPEAAEDPNRNHPKNWTRQRSKDSINDEEKEVEKFKNKPVSARLGTKLSRRNSNESEPVTPNPKAPPIRRHVTEVPRNHKYWDHDDRCDKDYNS